MVVLFALGLLFHGNLALDHGLWAAVRMAHESGGLKSAWPKRGAGACLVRCES